MRFLLLTLLVLSAHGAEEKRTLPWHQTYPVLVDSDWGHPQSIRTIQQIEDIIQTNGIGSVEALLAKLHTLDPEMFQVPIIVFWTKAVQEASYRYPRVILRSVGGKLMIAFNGHRDQLGYDSIEMMEYNEEQGRFLFADKTFSDRKKARASVFKCATCHAYPYEDPAMNRPLLEPSASWPRMYGGSPQSPKSEYELEEYARFKAAAKDHPRYRFLRLDDIAASCDPNKTADLPRAPRRIRKGSGPTKILLKFHALLSTWNMDRIVKLLARHPRYTELKPELTAILRREIARRFESGMESAKYSSEPTVNEEPFFDYKETDHDEKDPPQGFVFDGDAWDNLSCATNDNPPPSPHDASTHSLRFTRFLAEEFGFDLDYQGMSLARNARDYKLGIRFIPDILLRAVEGTPASGAAQKDAPPLWPDTPRLNVEKVLKANCASCHREGNSVAAKPIPFDDLGKFDSILDQKLAEKIQERLESSDVKKRMPKDLPALSDEEKDMILKHLESRLKQK